MGLETPGPMDDGETPFDMSGLKDRSIRNRQELNVAEFRNNAQATALYLLAKPSQKLAPFDVAWMLQLHDEMFGQVWEWAGTIRTENLNIGVPFHQINEQLQQLTENLRYWEGNWPDLVEQAVHLHVAAVRIHPFANGNGRWSRMLANIWLLQHDHPLTHWPESLGPQESSIRPAYIDAVKRAIHEGDFDGILELFRRFTT